MKGRAKTPPCLCDGTIDDPADVECPRHPKAAAVKHGTVTKHGFCDDCSTSHDGFEFWNEHNEEGRGHWFCRYCGSTHVTVRDAAGNIINE